MHSDGKAELFCAGPTLGQERMSVVFTCRLRGEMERQPFVGQRVNVKTIREAYIVISIADDGSTVELLTVNGTPSMLRNVLISDLSPARAEPDERKNNLDET
jgi:hypothetical protein